MSTTVGTRRTAMHASAHLPSPRARTCTPPARPGARAPQRGEAYVELFVVILQNVNKEETVQYVLAMLDDLLVGACCDAPPIGARDARSYGRPGLLAARGHSS